MNSRLLLEHVNEALAVELLAGETYPQYAQQAEDAEIKARLEEFGLESDQHRGALAQLIMDLGGRPSLAKELMATTTAWAKGFRDIGRRGTYGMLRNLQDLLIIEYRVRSNWQILEVVATATGDDRLRLAVDRVRPDEDKHIPWLEAKVLELASAALLGAAT